MKVLDAYIAFICVISMSVFIVARFKIPFAFAPLTVLSFTALWFSASIIIDALKLFGIIWYALGLCCLVLFILMKKSDKTLHRLINPASMFFLIAGLGAVTYLAIRQPVISEWDEFSLWATAVKLMKVTGQPYTTAEMGWQWIASQTPTLPALAFFMQFFGSYAAWKIYAAYALLMISVVAALIGTLSFKQYKIFIPLALTGMLVPWFFSVYSKEFGVKLVWLNSYADVPAGMLFGGVLIMYYGLRRVKAPPWPVYPALAALALTKDNTFIFAIIASALIACDLLIFYQKTPKILKDRGFTVHGMLFNYAPGRYMLSGRIFKSVSFMAVSLLPYLIWTKHIGYLVRQRAQTGQTGSTSEPLISVAINSIKMLLGIEERTGQFQTALTNMVNAFFAGTIHSSKGIFRVSMLGNGMRTSCFILFIFLLSIIFTANSTLRKKNLIAMCISTLGFIGYYFELIFSYGSIFKPEMVGHLENYGRYMGSYYIGWFLIALCCFALAVREGKPYGLLSGVNIVLSLCIWGLCAYMLPAGISDIGYSSAFYDNLNEKEYIGSQISEAAVPDNKERSRIFFVSQKHEMGLNWFYYSYYVLPSILDYSGVPIELGGNGGGGGNYIMPEASAGKLYELVYTPEEIAQYILDAGCDYVFVESLNSHFVENYAILFEDELAMAEDYDYLLYKVEVGEQKELILKPHKSFNSEKKKIFIEE